MADRADANNIAMGFLAERFCHKQAETGRPSDELADRLQEMAKSQVLDRAVFTLRWHKGRFSIYRDGYDKAIPDTELRAILAGHLVEKGQAVSRRLVSDILEVLSGVTRIDDDREPPFWLQGINGTEVITAQNGNISLSDKNPITGQFRLLPHTPLYYSLAAPLPFHYDPNATCPRFEHFLQESLGGDLEYVSFLQEWLGYFFVPGNPHQAFVMLLGSGANGKSTLIRVMVWLVGPSNVSHIPLSRFGDRFSLADLVGRRLNTANETITTIDPEGEARLKELTGGDTLAVERKFVQGRASFTPSAKLVIATNEMPRFKDRSSGLWRRLWLVPFNVCIPEHRQDPVLVEKLKAEAPGILNFALAGRDRLIAQGGFTIPADRASLLEDIRRSLDPVREFLTTTYAESSNGDFVPCSDVYGAYTEWSHTNGVRMVDERTFGRRVRDIFPASDRKQRGGRGSQVWVYLGVKPGTPTVHQQTAANGGQKEPFGAQNRGFFDGTPSTPSNPRSRGKGRISCMGGEW